jgi:hypothetical protein
MPSWINLILVVLASFRLTHLLVFDKIAEPLRKPIESVPFLGSLITCYWCTGIWVSAFLVLLVKLWPQPGYVIILILAVAGGQALLERWVEK